MLSDPITLYKFFILYMLAHVNFPLTNSQLTDFGELVAAHGNKFGFRRSRMCLLLFGHSAGILKACFRFG